MKRVFVLIVLAIFAHTSNALDQEFIDDFMDKLQGYAEECTEETHATADDIAELVARKIPPSTHEGKCMIFCIQRRFNVMKEDGSLNRAGAMVALKPLQQADPDLYQKILKVFVTCGMRAKVLPDPCDTATSLAECAKTESEAVGIDDSMLA